MKSRTMWLGLSLLLVASLVLASCGNNTTTTSTGTTSTTTTSNTVTTTSQTVSTTTATTTKATTTSSTTVAGVPQTGGTFTFLAAANNMCNADPTGWDHQMAINLGQGSFWGNPYMEKLLIGDIETYGPRGSNVFNFGTFENIPDAYWGGLLCTSWEIQTTPALTYTYHIRHGVMFTGNQKIGFAARELTASDVVFSEERAKTRPGFAAGLAWLASESAPDKYTVIWNCASFYALWEWRFNGTALGQIWAPEVVAAGPTDWRNQSGTGPYILSDFVSGSGATYVKNPNYWGTTTINGKTYQMPFIDKLIYPIIPDESTQIAAVRTGKIDWSDRVRLVYGPTLTQTSPDMIQQKYLQGICDYLKINRLNTASAMSNKALRQALMMGTDLNTIKSVIYGDGVTYSWPFAPGVPGYVDFNSLPAADQALWTYSVSGAKKMMSDAGYPNGFKVEILVSSANSQQVDLANLLVSQWAKIGVTANINIGDSTSVGTAFNNVSYKDMIMQNFTVVNPVTAMNVARATGAGSIYSTSEPEGLKQENLYVQMSATVDFNARTALLQQLGTAYMDDVGTIGFPNPYVINAYWPWFKNYYGELDASYYNQMPMIMRGWIDQNLKKSLGH